MTSSDILKVVEMYIGILERKGIYPINYPHNEILNTTSTALNHCLGMLYEIKQFIQKDAEKAHRWLGFIQGMLWANQIFTIEDLKNHNR